MGRAERSGPLPAASKASRVKRARETLNKTIPALLSSNSRARLGVASAKLITSTIPLTYGAESEILQSKLKIRVVQTDTISAAHGLHGASQKIDRIAVLNMASPLRPGGGFLTGASSQEEFLCMRSTLLPSLQDHFYRLPELGAVHTTDVLVFRNGEGNDIPKAEHFFVDVVTASMLRFPEIEDREYVNGADEEMVLAKMRTVMRVLVQRGATKVVLGAWGCGAYGNPVPAIARAWRKVLLGSNKQAKSGNNREMWRGLDDIVFAITNTAMVDVFNTCFPEVLDEDASFGSQH